MIKIDVHYNGTVLSVCKIFFFPSHCETHSWFDSDGGESGWSHLTDSSAASTLLFTLQLLPNTRKEIKKKMPAAHSSLVIHFRTKKDSRPTYDHFKVD